MLVSLRHEAAMYGLKVHMGQTKLLPLMNHGAQYVKVGLDQVQILKQGESERYFMLLRSRIGYRALGELSVNSKANLATGMYLFLHAFGHLGQLLLPLRHMDALLGR